MTNFTPEQQQIMDFVSKFGCVDINQLNIIMKPVDSDMVAILVNMLIKANRLELINEKIIVIRGEKQKYSRDIINCIWAMIRLTNAEGYHSALAGIAPAKIYFTRNGKMAFEAVPVNESSLISIRAVQDKVLAKSKQFKGIFDSYIVFVCENKDIMKKIKECNLKFQFIVVYIEERDNGSGQPTMKVLKSEPKPEQGEKQG